ncbi:hypothetical protein Adt_10562 [Abeliophyllum distichum]|uniref:Uncharacterized protein n=1 Tax=Abeliophyllum distichum TaxID=126358 RepID=A0ABD1UKD0_9LAMI
MDKLEKERILKDEVGEELVGEKQGREGENVTDETEYVEKGMSANFLTPDKLEEDANKSIEDDIVQINEIGMNHQKDSGMVQSEKHEKNAYCVSPSWTQQRGESFRTLMYTIHIEKRSREG